MPITKGKIHDLKLQKPSKLSRTPEYAEITTALKGKLGSDEFIKMSFTPETIELFVTKEKAATAFMQRLTREDTGKLYSIRAIGGEIVIQNRKPK
jgi:hypothetical protein